MKKILFSTVAVAFLAVSSHAELNLTDTSIGADVGTTGIGITAVKKIPGYDNKWGVRVGYHQFSKSYDTTDDNVNYDFDLDLQDFQVMADYHPWNTSFKVTFGAMYNGTEFSGNITPIGGTTYEFNGHTYTTSDIGGVNVDVEYDNDIAPYIGIGWDTSFYKPKNSWGFTFNLGVAYYGSAKVNYTPYIKNAALRDKIIKDLEVEKRSLEDDLDDFKYLPYISIGFNYKF